MNDKNSVVIHTDGACRGNPGPGGWGVVVSTDATAREISGAEPQTTNNRMELMAAIKALEICDSQQKVKLITDSQYVRKGITEWMKAWKARQWQTAARKPVKNRDLWERLDDQAQGLQVEWQWVKGHSGDAGNEHADQLANDAIDRLLAGDASVVDTQKQAGPGQPSFVRTNTERKRTEK